LLGYEQFGDMPRDELVLNEWFAELFASLSVSARRSEARPEYSDTAPRDGYAAVSKY
jgi:hypothetical protein